MYHPSKACHLLPLSVFSKKVSWDNHFTHMNAFINKDIFFSFFVNMCKVWNKGHPIKIEVCIGVGKHKDCQEPK